MQPRCLAAPHCKGSYSTSFYNVAEQFNPFQEGWAPPLEAHRDLCLLCTRMAINPLSGKGLGRAQHSLAVLAEPRHCMKNSGMAAWATLLDMVYIASQPKQQILTSLAAKEFSFGSQLHWRIAHTISVCNRKWKEAETTHLSKSQPTRMHSNFIQTSVKQLKCKITETGWRDVFSSSEKAKDKSSFFFFFWNREASKA